MSDKFEVARHSKRLVEQQRERIAALEAECERMRGIADHVRLQASIQAQEARTQRSIVMEIGAMVGCTDDFLVSGAVRVELAALKAPAVAGDERDARHDEVMAIHNVLAAVPCASLYSMAEAIVDAGYTRPAQTEQQPVACLSEEAASTLRGMVEYCLNQRVCMGMDEGFASFEPEVEHDFVKELRAFAESDAPIAQTPADGPNYKLKFENLVEHAKRQDKVIADMRYDENIRRYYDTGEVWFWAGDGTDNLDTLACPVVINAGDLRAFIDGRSADGLVEALEATAHALVFRPSCQRGLVEQCKCRDCALALSGTALAAHRAGGAS